MKEQGGAVLRRTFVHLTPTRGRLRRGCRDGLERAGVRSEQLGGLMRSGQTRREKPRLTFS